MKGRILGFSANEAGGAISGEDGKRYKFRTDAWKASRPPKAGEEVDYEIAADGTASEIYPLTPTPGIDLGDVGARIKGALGSGGTVDVGAVSNKARQLFVSGANSAAAEHAATLMRTRPTVPLALLLLIVSLFISLVGWDGQLPTTSDRGTASAYSVIGVSDFIDGTSSVMTMISKSASSTSFLSAGTDNSTSNIKFGAAATSVLLDLLYLLYLVPIGAIFILWREWQGRPMAIASLGVGALSVFGFLLTYATEIMINGTLKIYMGSTFAGGLASALGVHLGVHMAIGAWLLLIFGGLLILSTLGIFRTSRATA